MTSKLSQKPTVFRVGYARDIVNPLFNRLWIVPVASESAPQVASEFTAVQSDLVALYKSLGLRRLIIHCLVPTRKARPVDETLGYLALSAAQATVAMTFAHGTELPEQKQLQEVLVRAGEALPDRIRKTLPPGVYASTPFALWMLTLWKHATLGPFLLEEFPKLVAGLQWLDPIAESLFVIQGEWSEPMSKAEFAKRMLGRIKARARDIDPIFDSFEKIQVSDKKWMFRLDKLAAATRRKLEGRIG
jgi:hypothetical protein